MVGNFEDIGTGVSYQEFPKDPAAREAIAIVNDKVEGLKDTTVSRQVVTNLENKLKQNELDNDNFKNQVEQKIDGVKAIVDGLDGGNVEKIAEIETAVNNKANKDLVDNLAFQIQGSVKKINGVTPDENGDVAINLNTQNLVAKTEFQQKTDELAGFLVSKAEKANVDSLATEVASKASAQSVTALTSQLAETAKDVSVLSTTSIKVESFPKIVPEIDDTGRLQRAINSTSTGVIEFQHDKLYTISSNLIIRDKSNFRVTGANLKLTGVDTTGFKPTGIIDYLEIDHIWIQGDGLVTSKHKGIYSDSGQNITNFNYHHIFIMDVMLGVSINADTGGLYDKGSLQNITVINIVGKDPGQGYGIHSANSTNVTFDTINIDKAQRHSIYQAKGGKGNKYRNITISNHRLGVSDLTPRVAFNILRSEGVSVESVTFVGCYDGCLMISGDTPLTQMPCKNIEVGTITIINPMNNVQPVIIGEQMIPLSTTLTEGVRIKKVNYIIDSHKGGALLRFYNGKDINVEEVNITASSYESGIIGIELNDSYITDKTHADNLYFNNNKFNYQGTLPATARAYQVGSKYATGDMKVDIRGNDFNGMIVGNTVYFASALTNSNFTYAKKKFDSAIPNTTGATITTLEAELNKLKQTMRDLGLIKTI